MTATPCDPADNLPGYCRALAEAARAASTELAEMTGGERTRALHGVAEALRAGESAILEANAQDLAAGREADLAAAMLDRLTLDAARIEKIARSVDQIAEQPDPLGETVEGRHLPNGIELTRVRVPLGVILIIYESRPNVTVDAAALGVKSGNAVILRGGKEARHSNAALARCVAEALAAAELPAAAAQLVATTDRAAVGHLLQLEDLVDLAIPRGGESLIRAVVSQAHIPVIKHYAGNCHVYVDAGADPAMARAICLNAKTQRPGVCNAAETILFHRQTLASGLLEAICGDLAEAGVEIRGDPALREAFPGAIPAGEEDWGTEYLDLVVAGRVVDSLEEAIAHVNRYGSRHTDAIVTEHIDAARRFTRQVDSGNVFVNCSTRFSDGGEYGLGAEIGISTDKLHARGPMGARDLTTTRWIASGNGQVRT